MFTWKRFQYVHLSKEEFLKVEGTKQIPGNMQTWFGRMMPVTCGDIAIRHLSILSLDSRQNSKDTLHACMLLVEIPWWCVDDCCLIRHWFPDAWTSLSKRARFVSILTISRAYWKAQSNYRSSPSACGSFPRLNNLNRVSTYTCIPTQLFRSFPGKIFLVTHPPLSISLEWVYNKSESKKVII